MRGVGQKPEVRDYFGLPEVADKAAWTPKTPWAFPGGCLLWREKIKKEVHGCPPSPPHRRPLHTSKMMSLLWGVKGRSSGSACRQLGSLSKGTVVLEFPTCLRFGGSGYSTGAKSTHYVALPFVKYGYLTHSTLIRPTPACLEKEPGQPYEAL